MLEITQLVLILVVGLVAGFFDSALGAGGLISIPSLIFLGFPPQIAIATDRFGTLGQMTTAFFKFSKAKKILWKYVPILSVIGLVASVIGANILLIVDTNFLQQLIGGLLLVLLPLIILKPNIGVKKSKASKQKTWLGLFLFFIIMIFAGFFGQGTGPMIIYVLIYFLGFTMIEVLATGIIPWFVLSVSSIVIFAMNGIIDYEAGVVLLVGMAIGGYVGAHVVLEKGESWVKKLFILFVVVSGVKLLFF